MWAEFNRLRLVAAKEEWGSCDYSDEYLVSMKWEEI